MEKNYVPPIIISVHALLWQNYFYVSLYEALIFCYTLYALFLILKIFSWTAFNTEIAVDW